MFANADLHHEKKKSKRIRNKTFYPLLIAFIGIIFVRKTKEATRKTTSTKQFKTTKTYYILYILMVFYIISVTYKQVRHYARNHFPLFSCFPDFVLLVFRSDLRLSEL
jgi:hypothetical protein